ncbi:protein CREG1 [Zootermopsis nevadensis]|uniref:Protein CREG1 n=1 Tax=Zootermopsis nevadensis TaxID=136037 RepID=A0A067R8C9_ZOONE|nr:protein CREG1 [Zootermopsis nevadensis]XP_021919301.1 protein CREG1 [Zootermopsis nevadensis]KDR19714.1 Protein CREG1 [Zootermopsis nevadensis]
MYNLVLVVLVTALCVDSLTVYGSHNTFLFNTFDQEEEDNVIDSKKEPPPHSEVAKMARYIVHNSEWALVAYKSQQLVTNEFPMGTVLSVSDGPLGSGNGTPYVYVSELEDAIQDTDKDSRCSLTMTLAEGSYCKEKKLDPQYPTCPQVTLVGRIERVKNGTTEEAFAQEALFSRHPSMKTWPKDHNFFFMKLSIERVMIVDYFGGPIYVDVDDYFNVTP